VRHIFKEDLMFEIELVKIGIRCCPKCGGKNIDIEDSETDRADGCHMMDFYSCKDCELQFSLDYDTRMGMYLNLNCDDDELSRIVVLKNIKKWFKK
jgi:hypothetical protein